MRYSVLLIRLTLFLFLASPAIATSDDWVDGKREFDHGNYAAALEHFERARDSGLEGPAVHYNIAVSQFKLSRFDAADATFSFIDSQFPSMRGLAQYNLGLIAERQDDDLDARDHYLRAYQLSTDNETIRILASRRLGEIDPDTSLTSRWRGTAGVRAGYDDNVALRDEVGLPAGTSTDSPMADIFVAIETRWPGNSDVRFNASAYAVSYTDADEFDQTQLRGGASYDWRYGDWRLRVGAHLSATTLGGDPFDRKVGGRAHIARNLSRDTSINLRYAIEDVSDADSLFAGVDGQRRQLELQYLWYQDAQRVQLRYQLETNDRLDPGVSPDRHRVTIDYRFRPAAGIGYEASFDIRDSDYNELTTPRNEKLQTVSAALTYVPRDRWEIFLELRRSDNDSTDETFSYDRTQISLGVTKLF